VPWCVTRKKVDRPARLATLLFVEATDACSLAILFPSIDCFCLVDVARPTNPRANNALISLVDTFRVEEPPMQRCGRGMLPGL
jgi:hypothetical protein